MYSNIISKRSRSPSKSPAYDCIVGMNVMKYKSRRQVKSDKIEHAMQTRKVERELHSTAYVVRTNKKTFLLVLHSDYDLCRRQKSLSTAAPQKQADMMDIGRYVTANSSKIYLQLSNLLSTLKPVDEKDWTTDCCKKRCCKIRIRKNNDDE